MKVSQLRTPAFLLDLDQLDKNIQEVGALAKAGGKQFWPMVKTHKSTYLAQKQAQAGASGFLVGTVDEAESLVAAGLGNIMLAYPYFGEENIARIAALAAKGNLYCSVDSLECAQQYDRIFGEEGLTCQFLLIVDCGLHRLGVPPEGAADLAAKIARLPNSRLCGIGTHPGHVYACASGEGIRPVYEEEEAALRTAYDGITSAGIPLEIVATGSTPTMALESRSSLVTTMRPGNYVFYDAIQMALGVATEEMCALTVLCTVIAKREDGHIIVDCGSKCLGLDKGAHGNVSIVGYGKVIGHPSLVVESLSEEVGKISVNGDQSVAIGDRLRIIPNHSCSSANMTGYLTGVRGDEVVELIPVDIRGNSRKPGC